VTLNYENITNYKFKIVSKLSQVEFSFVSGKVKIIIVVIYRLVPNEQKDVSF